MFKNKKIYIAAGILIILAAAVAAALIVTKRGNNLIRVKNINSGQVLKSNFVIEGEARGYWYFEASFPVKLYDGNGNLISVAIAQAQGDWMIEDFVPFKATINFDLPATAAGILVFEKDNPSGLSENAASFSIPVKFETAAETMAVKVYFNNGRLDPEFSCNKVFSVERTIPKTQAVARAVLNELLKGTTQLEQSNGFFSSLNSGVAIQSLAIDDGAARVDFNERLDYQVGGSCRVAAIRAQITETLKQFQNVNDVVISINGRTEDILQP